DTHGSGLLCEECGAHAISPISVPTSVCWLGCDRSGLQDCNRLPPQTIWYVLDCTGSQRDSRFALLSSQPPLCRLLGGPMGGLTSTYISRTQGVLFPRENGGSNHSSPLQPPHGIGAGSELD